MGSDPPSDEEAGDKPILSLESLLALVDAHSLRATARKDAQEAMQRKLSRARTRDFSQSKGKAKMSGKERTGGKVRAKEIRKDESEEESIDLVKGEEEESVLSKSLVLKYREKADFSHTFN